MRPHDPSEDPGDYQGLLLAALPNLKDPNFRRSVLFLTMHDAEAGAFGFVLNRPLGKNAADLLPEHERRSVLERVPVYVGGPVGHDQLGFAEVDWDAGGRKVRLETNLSLDEVEERLAERPGCVRAFVGYSGWSAGQLEGELAQKAWVLLKPDRAATDPGAQEKLWFKIMSSLGPEYKLLAAAPDDPALN